ncbi:MAG: hypothetical protein ACM3SY_06675 [Candidatus Omnitrophota bacterium]
MGTESRLSQLTRWVLEADAQGLPFGLRIPGTQIEWSAGPSHTTASLEALALFQWPVQND